MPDSRSSGVNLAPGQLYAAAYTIGERLGAGGTGTVYRARHVALQQERALKVLVAPGDGSELDERLRLEASVFGRLSANPSLVMPLDVGFDAATRTHFVAMELLRGVDLGRWVRERGPVSPRSALHVLRQVAVGVDAAHGYVDERGEHTPIVHRDLTPSNLFVLSPESAEPTIKILDFGLAELLAPGRSVRQKTSGTALFRSYEQANGLELAPQTDIWALGLVVHFMLSGEHYWLARSASELAHEITSAPLEPPGARLRRRFPAARVPAAFDAWLLRCLERVPARRFPSVRAAADELELCFPAPALDRPLLDAPVALGVVELAGTRTHTAASDAGANVARTPELLLNELADRCCPILRRALRSADDVLTAAGHYLAFAPDSAAVLEQQLGGVRHYVEIHGAARRELLAETGAIEALARELHARFEPALYDALSQALASVMGVAERRLDEAAVERARPADSPLASYAEHAQRWQAERGRLQVRLERAQRHSAELQRQVEVAFAPLELPEHVLVSARADAGRVLAAYGAALVVLQRAVLEWLAALEAGNEGLHECAWRVLAPAIAALNEAYLKLDDVAPALGARLAHPRARGAALASALREVYRFHWDDWRPEINGLIVPVVHLLIGEGADQSDVLRADVSGWQRFAQLLGRAAQSLAARGA